MKPLGNKPMTQIEEIAVGALNRIGIMAKGGSAYTSDFTYNTETILREALDDIEKIQRKQRLSIVKGEPMEPMLQFFQYKHLPENLQGSSKIFCDLAEEIVNRLPRNPERTVALRKLLEAKDAGVRSLLYKQETA
jgi:hypothetical protein